MYHRGTSVLATGPRYTDETASFIGFAGVLLVCFGERGSSSAHRFTVTSRALWSAHAPSAPRAPIY